MSTQTAPRTTIARWRHQSPDILDAMAPADDDRSLCGLAMKSVAPPAPVTGEVPACPRCAVVGTGRARSIQWRDYTDLQNGGEASNTRIPWLQTVPMATSDDAGVTPDRPFVRVEAGSPNAKVGCLIVVAGGLTFMAEPTNTPYAGPGYAIRDLAGFIGLALLGTAALGPTFSWALPLAYTVACGNALDAGLTAGWTWPTRAAGDRTGILTATALLAVGITISVTAPSTRDGRDT